MRLFARNSGASWKAALLFILFCLAFQSAYSQQYFFKQYSLDDGLPQSSVKCILQDRRGYIWMGTEGGGVVQFDGNKFNVFTTVDGLSDNSIWSLFEDNNGNIWIGTSNGLTIYNGINLRKIGKPEGLTGTQVLKITQSADGAILAATGDEGLFRITMKDSLRVMNYSQNEGLSHYFIFDIYEDKGKRLWLAGPGGLNITGQITDSTKKLENIISPDFHLPPDTTFLTVIKPDKDGNIWLGLRFGKGLYKAVPAKDQKGFTIIPSQINKLIPDFTIWDILCRDNGELWIATDNDGVLRVKDDKIIGRIDKRNGLPTNQIYRLMADREDNCWFGTLDQGAVLYNGERFIGYRNEEGLIGNGIFSMLLNSENDMYVSTEEGMLHLAKDNENIKRLDFKSSKTSFGNAVANTLVKRENKIWIGTYDGIFILDKEKIQEFPQNNKLPDRKINCLLNDNHNNLWIGTNGGLSRYSNNPLFNLTMNEGLIHNEVQTIIEDSRDNIWMGTVGGLVKLSGKNYSDYRDFDAAEGLSSLWINCLAEDKNGNIWIGTFGGGIFRFNITRDSIPISIFATKGVLASNNIKSLLFVNDTTLLAGTDIGFDYITLSSQLAVKKVVHYGLNDGFTGGEINVNAIAKEKGGIVWFGTKNGLVRFNPSIDAGSGIAPITAITGIKLGFETVNWEDKGYKVSKWSRLPEKLVLSYKDNHVTFNWTGITSKNPENVTFTYILEPQTSEWSPYASAREMPFSGLNPGDYTFKVKARNKFGIEGNTAEFKFTIRPPFWKTKWFIGSTTLLIIVLLVVYIRLRERNLIREKVKLENIVKERTREVVEQKDEIARQRDVVTGQKKEITDSISYAKRIQVAVLPDENIFTESFSEHLIIYRPKDIVSGDFYWMSRRDDNVVFTAADCTGHGVPGAFMSMLGVSFLNKIVNEMGIVDPGQILNHLRENIIAALKQRGLRDESKDGMDIALCSYNRRTRKLSFAGANNPLYILRKTNGEYTVIDRKGDSMPIGIHEHMEDFTKHELEVQAGDSIYLFSDGIIDQFGGPEGRKFMRKRLVQMFLDHQGLPMAEQRDAYLKILEDWISHTSEKRPTIDQTDDITVLGVKI